MGGGASKTFGVAMLELLLDLKAFCALTTFPTLVDSLVYYPVLHMGLQEILVSGPIQI